MYHLASTGFETFIYIVFAILYLVYKINSAKKNKEQNKNTKPFSFPDFMQNFEVKENDNDDIMEKIKEYAPAKSVKTKKIRVKKAPSAQMEIIEIEEETGQSEILGLPVKEAIIISEILKRPEY